MPKKLLLLRAFFKKEFTLMRRYFVNSIGTLLTMYIIFLLLFGGYQGLKGVAGMEGDTAETLVVGFVLWLFMLSTYQDVSYGLITEAREGTLEQLYMSPHGIGWVMGARIAANFLLNLTMVAVILLVSSATSGVSLNLDVLSLFPILIGILLGSSAVGFAIGGITLIFKRIESYTQMVQFLLIALVAVPAGPVPLFRLLPGSFGAHLVRRVMMDGVNLVQIGLWNLTQLFAIGVFHLILGYGLYKLCERRAMLLGTLGHY